MGRLDTQVSLFEVIVVEKFLSAAAQHNADVFQHIAADTYLQGLFGIFPQHPGVYVTAP